MFFRKLSSRHRIGTTKMIALIAVILISAFPSSTFGISNSARMAKGNQAETSKFSLTLLSPYTIANSPLNVQIQTDNTTSPIKIEVMSSTSTQSELFNFAENLGKRRVRDTLEIPFASLIPDASLENTYSFQIPVNGEGPTSLSMGGANIYPVAISQASDKSNTRTQYSFVTSIPSIGSNGAAFSQRLQLLNFLKFQPVIDRIGMVDSNGKLTKKGRETEVLLDSAKQTLAGVSSLNTPHSLLINPDAFDGYSYLNAIRDPQKDPAPFYTARPLPSSEYIANTYVPINIAELEKQDSLDVYPNLLGKSRDFLKSTNIDAPARTLITETVTESSLKQISDSGIDQVIVDEDTFKSNQKPITKFARLKSGSTSIDVVTYNTSIENSIPKSLSSASKANYLIAATSVIALEAPSNLRGFVLPLDLAKLDETTVTQYLSFLNGSPLVEAKTSSQFFKENLLDKSLSKRLEDGQYPKKVSDPIDKDKVEETISFANASTSMYEPESLEYRQASWMKLAIFSPSSFNISKIVNPNSAKKLAIGVASKIELPEKRTLTITSRENDIPVTIKKNTPEKIRVVVRISSARLLFPKGTSFPIELVEENTTVTIPVKARTSGSFPISIEVVSPSESIVVAEQTATVRSTTLSGTGVFIALGSAVFLMLWWASHYKKARKKPIAPVLKIQNDMVG